MRTLMLLAVAVVGSAQVASGQQAPSFPGTTPAAVPAQPWPLPGSWYAPPAYALPGPNGGVPAPQPGYAVVPLQVPETGAMPPGWVQANLAEEAAASVRTPPTDVETSISHPQWAWVGLDYALGWIRPRTIRVPLLTRGSTDDPPILAGAIGQPGTVVLLGPNNKFDIGTFDGIRPEVGFFLDDHHHLSLEATGFILFDRDRVFTARSNNVGEPLLARPFLGADTGTEGRLLVSSPITGLTGSFTATASSEFYGFEVNTRYNDVVVGKLQANVLTGFRFLNLRERLLLVEQLRPLAPGALNFGGPNNFVPVGSSTEEVDNFTTNNRFYGWQIGIGVGWEDPLYYVRMSTKLGLGATWQEGSINGSSTLISDVGNQVLPGGVLALTSNIGTHKRTVFGLVSETGIQTGLRLHRNVNLQAGYTFLLWNKVTRPEDLIDRTLNRNLVPTSQTFGLPPDTQAPQQAMRHGPVWSHLFNLGVELLY